VGWYIDDLTATNVQQVQSSAIAAATPARTFNFSPGGSGSYLLEVRPLLFGDYPSEWGPSLTVTAAPNVHVTGIQRASGNTWNINFTVSGGGAGYELWSSSTVNTAFTKEASATIQTIVAGSQYRAVITTIGTQKFFRIRAL
jgi:hypothetical protein